MRRLMLVEPVERSAVWARRLATFALAVAALAVALARVHAAAPSDSLTVFGAALVLAAFAAALALAAAPPIWRDGRAGAEQAALAFALAAALMAYPVYLAGRAFLSPPINDVSTDLEQPPTFLATAKARQARGEAEPRSSSAEMRAAQRAAYPDLETVRVRMDATEAYELALNAASDLGWKMVDAAPPRASSGGVGTIEAMDSSLFFGFPSDIVIRVRPELADTAIDARAVSRVGRHDFGAGARRLRRFIEAAHAAAGDQYQ
ncbi:MAG: DUF1499 domain-containing protein [Hyphomicrobiales bacterium]|nr:DUF1499 domain-containing protein [Hyphomicrobiales bacterium]